MSDRRQEHYFSPHPTSLRQPEIFEDILRGVPVKCWTDHGVFSRGHIDNGTCELLKAVDFRGAERILDLGCGYGVIGLVAAKLVQNARVLLTDPNSRAIELTRQNIAANDLDNAEARQGEGFLPVQNDTFDLILTNPPIRAGNAVIFALITEAAAHLRPGGAFYLVARTKQGAKTFAKEMARHFSRVEQVGQGSGFRVYRGTQE